MRTSPFQLRLYAFVPANQVNMVNNAISNHVTKKEADSRFLNARFSASGNLPATYYGACSVITPRMRVILQRVDLSALFSSIKLYVTNMENDVLVATSSDTAQGRVGSVFTYGDALTDLGLIRIDV